MMEILSRRVVVFLGLFFFMTSLLVQSCYKAKLVVPYGKTVYLAKGHEIGIKRTKRVWYLLGGLVAISDNTPTEIIYFYNCHKVRMKFYISFIDGLISSLTLGIVTPATMEVVCIPEQQSKLE